MKDLMKIIYIFFSFAILSFGYYFISFYPYLNRMQEIIQKVDNRNVELVKKNIIEEKRKSLIISKQNISINSLLRRQSMMSVYNNFVIKNRRKNFKGLWRIDRLFWSYLSYLHFSDSDVLKIYLYYNLIRHPSYLLKSSLHFGTDSFSFAHCFTRLKSAFPKRSVNYL